MFTFTESPLSAKEERELIKNTKNREELEQKLVAHNYKMVLQMAHKYEYVGDFEELVQEGCRGLVIAAKKFDTSRNIKFNSFAVHYVKKYLLQSIYTENKEKRISDDKTKPVVSLDGPLTTEDIKSIDNSTYNIETCDNDAKKVLIEAIKACLDDVEQKIIHDRFMVRKTLDELRQELNYSLSNVRAIEQKALAKLQRHFNSCNIYSVMDMIEVA